MIFFLGVSRWCGRAEPNEGPPAAEFTDELNYTDDPIRIFVTCDDLIDGLYASMWPKKWVYHESTGAIDHVTWLG